MIFLKIIGAILLPIAFLLAVSGCEIVVDTARLPKIHVPPLQLVKPDDYAYPAKRS